ncbi:hypothetical protein BH11ACT2_BH11ACT2_15110 [soil metagenome]
MADISATGRALVGGTASGRVLRCTQAISGWGGIDPKTGAIIETGHPQRGELLGGRVLVIPGAKGSSGWSGQFHLAKLIGTSPAAIVTSTLNSKLALGLTILGIPAVIELPEESFKLLETGQQVTVHDGIVTIHDLVPADFAAPSEGA